MKHSRGAGRDQWDEAFTGLRHIYTIFTRAGVAKRYKRADARRLRRKARQDARESARGTEGDME